MYQTIFIIVDFLDNLQSALELKKYLFQVLLFVSSDDNIADKNVEWK